MQSLRVRLENKRRKDGAGLFATGEEGCVEMLLGESFIDCLLKSSDPEAEYCGAGVPGSIESSCIDEVTDGVDIRCEKPCFESENGLPDDRGVPPALALELELGLIESMLGACAASAAAISICLGRCHRTAVAVRP